MSETPANPDPQDRPLRRKPWVAAVFTILLPGLGQLYNGQTCLTLLVLVLLACTPSARAVQDAVVIQHVTVIPMTSAATLARHIVVVSDGRITADGNEYVA